MNRGMGKGKQATHRQGATSFLAVERSGKVGRHTLPWLGGILVVCMAVDANAFDSGSTGADGAFSPTGNIDVQLPPSGILNYTTVNIPAGVTVKFKRNATNTPVYMLASGNVTIAGTIDVSGENSKDVGTAGNGNVADDGLPGRGGPGGFDGGRGGLDGLNNVRGLGGSGLGPGGGRGGDGASDGCTNTGYFHLYGMPAAYVADALSPNSCPANSVTYKASAYGSNLLQPLIGGSGGGGGYGGTQFPGIGGGGGGGALLIASSTTIGLTGAINANGGGSGGAGGSGTGGLGGPGSGGAVRLVATTVTGSGTINAYGGYSSAGYSYGATGSSGRIRLEADYLTYTGTTSPTRVYSTPNPVFVANVPTLKIASVADQAVPDAPTGLGDVTLPANAGTVNVTFASANVPVGTQVKLRVVPTMGAAIDADPVLITGSSEAGTATVAVTLPEGSSTLQATAIYTVSLAAAESQSLTQYAQNEAVEKVQLTVDTQRGTLAKLITASGKSYDISYELLRASGFRG